MTQMLARIARRADDLCARLNDGLAAVAILLALVTTAVLLQRLPAALPHVPPAIEDAIAAVSP